MLSKITNNYATNDCAEIVATGNQARSRAGERVAFLEGNQYNIDDPVYDKAFEEIEDTLAYYMRSYAVHPLQAPVEIDLGNELACNTVC